MIDDTPDQIRLACDQSHKQELEPHGVSIDNCEKALVLYPARSKSIAALHGRIMVALCVAAVCCAVAVYTQVFHCTVVLILYSIVLLLSYFYVRRKLSRAVLPVIEMRSDAIEIHSLYFDMSIPWAELKEVRTFTVIEPHLGIVPHNLKRLLELATTKTKVSVWMTAAYVPLYRILGIYVTPIFVLESELPLTAAEIAELINLRRAHALGVKQLNEAGQAG